MTEDLTDDPGNRVKQGSRERLVHPQSVKEGWTVINLGSWD